MLRLISANWRRIKKYYSCSLVKKHSHFFDRLLATPYNDEDDFYKFKISRNWEMWRDNDDPVTTAFFQHYNLEKRRKVVFFHREIFKANGGYNGYRHCILISLIRPSA